MIDLSVHHMIIVSNYLAERFTSVVQCNAAILT